MQNTLNGRKRPAPGTAPLIPQQNGAPPTYPYQQMPENPDFTNFDFSTTLPAADPTYADPASAFDGNNFNFAVNNSSPQALGAAFNAPTTSTDLVRRARNQQLAPQHNGQPGQWNGYASVNAQMNNTTANNINNDDDEDEQDLDAKVALAKKDAQGKRKNILPFVQKLSSFLDSNNTDLIRWSDDGRSFIVLDEDEFASTLIPEVFKHSNYASFVRQLNMYGFHKTVNITDGSLRQSEKARKGVKPPSMYSHPYFRRNRPDLLWLVQKPAGGSKTTKRKREGGRDGYDSDDGRQYSPAPELAPQHLGATNSSQDLAQLPRNELAAVRRELQNLQTQQKYISQMITQLKEQNDTFYRQASTFQALHDRHENSINAILTFLATFYRQGLEGHGAQNLVNMFTNMPSQNQQQHGSVVEEYNDGTPTPTNQVQRFVKRPPLLLPGPASANTPNQNLQPGSAATEPSSSRASATPPNDISNHDSTSSAPPDSVAPLSASTPTIKTEAQTPNNDQMMNMINNANATTQASTPGSSGAPTAVDMNSIVDRINQNNSPLTPQQREDMVNSVLGGGAGGSSNSALASFKNAAGETQQWKEQLDQSHHALDYLQQLQKQQDAKVQELNRRLQPLSPTGMIPGLHDFNPNQDPFDGLGAPGDYDPGAFINFDDPQPWETGGQGDGGDFDFNFDDDGNAANWGGFEPSGDSNDMFGTGTLEPPGNETLAPDEGGGRVESVSGSEATSPATAQLLDEDQQQQGSANKRARRS